MKETEEGWLTLRNLSMLLRKKEGRKENKRKRERERAGGRKKGPLQACTLESSRV